MECPVCFKILKYPFKCCTNGHGICTECAKAVELCPTCQALFTEKNTSLPLCVKNVLEALPMFCCYSDAGCDTIVEHNDEHEKFCGFRPFHCKVKDCDVTVPLCKLMSHIEETHDKYSNIWIIKTSKKQVQWPNFSITCRQDPYHTPIYLFNNWSWVIEKKNIKEQCFELTFYTTPISKPVDNHYIKIKFKMDSFVYTNTLRAYEISSCVAKDLVDWDSLSRMNNNCHKMKVPFDNLKYLIDKESSLNYEFVFFSMPKDK